MSVSLDEIVTGLGLLGNVMSLPRQVQNQQIQNEQTRALLKDSGLPPEMIASATPEPMMRWLSPQQGGFTGHLLGGVGDVGSILSTVVGKPVKAPRVDLADLASASKLRSAHAQALAKDRLGKVILDPNSTNRDIAAAAIEAGDTNESLRLLRRGDEPWRGTPGERVTLTEQAQRDYRRQAAANMTFRDERERQNFVEGGIMPPQEPATPHYNPAQTYRMRHDEEQKQRDKDAQAAGYKPGSPEHKYWLAFGHPPIARQPKAEPTYEEDFAVEQRRRDALIRSGPRGAKAVAAMEPVDVTVRRNRAARTAGKTAEQSGADIPPPPPPPAARGATGGAAVGAVLGGSPTETPTTTEATTTTTQPPDTSDAAADAILGSIDMESLPPDIQTQVHAAAAAGMPKWPLANWLLSVQQASQPGPPAPPR